MARNRKKEPEIPMKRPSEQEQIPEDEIQRLIDVSGVLKTPKPEDENEKPEPLSLSDEIFNATLLIIPFSFLFLLMDIMIHQQYAQHPTFMEEVKRMATNVPILALYIFYTHRHKANWFLQCALAVQSAVCGTRLIWVINNSPWGVVMQQCPPLGVLWIYAIVQLDLIPATLSLGVIGGLVKYWDLKVIF